MEYRECGKEKQVENGPGCCVSVTGVCMVGSYWGGNWLVHLNSNQEMELLRILANCFPGPGSKLLKISNGSRGSSFTKSCSRAGMLRPSMTQLRPRIKSWWCVCLNCGKPCAYSSKPLIFCVKWQFLNTFYNALFKIHIILSSYSMTFCVWFSKIMLCEIILF